MPVPFHVAVPVSDLEVARHFYGEQLGFAEGRSADCWIDFNMFGHQFVVHQVENHSVKNCGGDSLVDDQTVPIPHYGVVLDFSDWQTFADKVMKHIPEYLCMQPVVRFKGQPGEQGTFFFKDPFGNALEFKGFRDIENSLFAR